MIHVNLVAIPICYSDSQGHMHLKSIFDDVKC